MSAIFDWLFGTRRSPTPTQYNKTSPHDTAPAKPSRKKRKTFQLVEKEFDPDGVATDLIWRGFVVADDQGNYLTYDDPDLRDTGIYIFKVAGVSHREQALQSEAFSPGNVLTLVVEDNNPHDPNAVSIWDEHRTQTIGYVPREENETIRAMLQLAPNSNLMSLAESRKGGKRVGLQVIFGPFKKTREEVV